MKKWKFDREEIKEKLEIIGFGVADVAIDLVKDAVLIMFGALLALLWVTTDSGEED